MLTQLPEDRFWNLIHQYCIGYEGLANQPWTCCAATMSCCAYCTQIWLCCVAFLQIYLQNLKFLHKVFQTVLSNPANHEEVTQIYPWQLMFSGSVQQVCDLQHKRGVNAGRSLLVMRNRHGELTDCQSLVPTAQFSSDTGSTTVLVKWSAHMCC